jgi:hypothetical protein
MPTSKAAQKDFRVAEGPGKFSVREVTTRPASAGSFLTLLFSRVRVRWSRRTERKRQIRKQANTRQTNNPENPKDPLLFVPRPGVEARNCATHDSQPNKHHAKHHAETEFYSVKTETAKELGHILRLLLVSSAG